MTSLISSEIGPMAKRGTAAETGQVGRPHVADDRAAALRRGAAERQGRARSRAALGMRVAAVEYDAIAFADIAVWRGLLRESELTSKRLVDAAIGLAVAEWIAAAKKQQTQDVREIVTRDGTARQRGL